MRASRVKAEADYVEYFVMIRWPRGPQCLLCESRNIRLIKTRAIFQCADCRKQFSVFKGTQFGSMRLLPSQLFAVLARYYQTAGAMTVRETQGHLETKIKSSAYSSAHRLSKKLKAAQTNWETTHNFDQFVIEVLLHKENNG